MSSQMEGQYIVDVVDALRAHATEFFPAVDVYVINFQAKIPYPRRFVYNACKSCKKSLEDRARLCEHHGDKVLAHLAEKRYRFDVFIADAIIAAQPIRATIFEAVEVLLGVAANDFAKWDEHSQEGFVCDTMYTMQHFVVKLKVANGQVTIGSLRKQSAFNLVPQIGTPVAGRTSVYATPPREVPTSGSRRPDKESELELREKVKKVTDMLTSMFLEEEQTITNLGEEDGIQRSW